MWIGIISLFPEMFRAITDYGIISRGIKNGLLNIKIWNPRDFTYNKHRTVDNRPYGGGPGMVMMAEPLRESILAAKNIAGKNTKVIYMSPQGYLVNQENIRKLALNKKLILVCGRYEGVDERLIKACIDEEYSIGNYILSGGELPAMILIDSISRLIPGMLGHKSSLIEDSFSNGLLEYPHYTRPKILGGMRVPSVLLSGDHKKIKHWRMKQSLRRTLLRKPELLENVILTKEQIKLLTEFNN